MTRDAATTTTLTGGALTRARILDAAADLLATIGLTRATTKQIARAADCSEATLYKHFRDKEEIFVRVLRERVPEFPQTLAMLASAAGTGEIADNLREVARAAVGFYRRSFPMAGSLFASPDLLVAHRQKLNLATTGPQHAARNLAGYLAAEQRLGRVAAGADPDAAAALLVGACFHRAFLDLFLGPEAEAELRPADDEEFVTDTIATLLAGLAP